MILSAAAILLLLWVLQVDLENRTRLASRRRAHPASGCARCRVHALVTVSHIAVTATTDSPSRPRAPTIPPPGHRPPRRQRTRARLRPPRHPGTYRDTPRAEVTDWLAAEQGVRRDRTGNATGNGSCRPVPSGPGAPTMLPPSLRSVGLPPRPSAGLGSRPAAPAGWPPGRPGPCPGTCDTGRDRTRD